MVVTWGYYDQLILKRSVQRGSEGGECGGCMRGFWRLNTR
jgi:hypothetical protein